MSDGVVVAVLGPGAVGGALAVPLALSGVRVICVARPETATAIAREGLTLDRPDAPLHARLEATEELRQPVDLLLVTVKAPALDDALRRVVAPANAVVPLLNGIEHLDALRASLKGSRVIAGSVGRLEAYRAGPTRIVQATPAMEITLASGGDTAAELLQRAGSRVRIDGSESAVLWEKLVRQAALAAATAATLRPVGELRSSPEWRTRLEAGIDEACAVAAKDGVELRAEAQWEIIDAMPTHLTTSTARDVAAGRPSELDAITGAVVRAGRRLGIPTPTLAELLVEAEKRCRARSR